MQMALAHSYSDCGLMTQRSVCLQLHFGMDWIQTTRCLFIHSDFGHSVSVCGEKTHSSSGPHGISQRNMTLPQTRLGIDSATLIFFTQTDFAHSVSVSGLNSQTSSGPHGVSQCNMIFGQIRLGIDSA